MANTSSALPPPGNRYRYRYYTCFSRQRYGTKTCNAERLPADELEQAILDALLTTYNRSELFDDAVRAAWSRADDIRAHQQAELDSVEAETAKIEQAIQRYLLAFEGGSLPEAQCASRLHDLGATLAELRDRQAELKGTLDGLEPAMPTPELLAEVHTRIRRAIDNGSLPGRKSLLEELVHEIRVTSRADLRPFFRIPSATPKVRTHTGSVGSACHHANPARTVEGSPITLSRAHAKIRREGYRTPGGQQV